MFHQLARRSLLTTARSVRRLATSSHEYIIVSQPSPAVSLVTLNRPKALNALCSPLFAELNQALEQADADPNIGAIVITGSEKAFAAGADIKEMQSKTYSEVYAKDFLADWQNMTKVKKPIIAAVSGYALGGGCELALMCDIILASSTAKFGQPEISLGVIPGGGGTQRLAGIIGKSRTMELVLTGRMFDAEEAEKWGVVSKIVREEKKEGDEYLPVVKEALDMAKKIASFGRLSAQAGKETVNAALELPLAEGLRFERRVFHGLFATADQKEGMSAFAEKRKPNFTHS